MAAHLEDNAPTLIPELSQLLDSLCGLYHVPASDDLWHNLLVVRGEELCARLGDVHPSLEDEVGALLVHNPSTFNFGTLLQQTLWATGALGEEEEPYTKARAGMRLVGAIVTHLLSRQLSLRDLRTHFRCSQGQDLMPPLLDGLMRICGAAAVVAAAPPAPIAGPLPPPLPPPPISPTSATPAPAPAAPYASSSSSAIGQGPPLASASGGGVRVGERYELQLAAVDCLIALLSGPLYRSSVETEDEEDPLVATAMLANPVSCTRAVEGLLRHFIANPTPQRSRAGAAPSRRLQTLAAGGTAVNVILRQGSLLHPRLLLSLAVVPVKAAWAAVSYILRVGGALGGLEAIEREQRIHDRKQQQQQHHHHHRRQQQHRHSWYQLGAQEASSSLSPLAQHSVLLLLLLVVGGGGGRNSFLDALNRVGDSEARDEGERPPATPGRDAPPGGGGGGGGEGDDAQDGSRQWDGPVLSVPYRKLYTALGSALSGAEDRNGVIGTDEHVVLLLYKLLQGNNGFFQAVAVRSDIDVLLLPLLRDVYHADQARGRGQLYLLAINVLLFTQDADVNANAFKRSKIPSVPWYSSRSLQDVSLGNLMVLSVLKLITYTTAKLRDPYLLQNCFGILSNIAPHVEHLDAYTADRIVDVLLAASNKWLGLQRSGEISAVAAAAEGVDEMEDDLRELLEEAYGETVRVVLSLVCKSIRPKRLVSNKILLYSLLHSEGAVSTLLAHPLVVSGGWAGSSLPALMAHFRALLEAYDGGFLSVDAANEVVEQAAKNYSAECGGASGGQGGHGAEEGRAGFDGAAAAAAQDDGPATFEYEENEESKAFFVPYAWECVLAVAGGLVRRDAIELFFVPEDEPLPKDPKDGVAATEVAPDLPSERQGMSRPLQEDEEGEEQV